MRIIITCYDYDKSVINALSSNNNSSNTVLFVSPCIVILNFTLQWMYGMYF